MRWQRARLVALVAFLILFVARLSGAPVVNAVVNGASYAQAAIGPGTIIAIFGTALSRSTLSATTLPLPTSLDGTSVSVNGQPIPLFFVSPGQINAQLPFQLANGSAQLMVRDPNGATGSRTITIAPTSPAIFTISADGKGEAIAVHADFKLVRKAVLEYATIGETIVLFCTGLGGVENFTTAGAASPVANAISKPTVLMDGRPAQVIYAGLAPGFVGLYQINFVVPQGVGGDVVTTVRSGDVTSNAATINVAGVYTLAENYTGVIEYRSGDRFQLDLSSFTTPSATRFAGRYRLSAGSRVIDAGSFLVQATETIFVGAGTSEIVGGQFVTLLDTLDAGRSFLGVLYESPAKLQNDPDGWYAAFEVTAIAPQRPAAPPAVLPGITSSCGVLEGALVFADDGTFLGRITSNTFAADSIGNPFGRYGSEFSTTSIFNAFGPYGSQFSPTSAFNDLATRPPVIFVSGRAVAFLTTNTLKTPRVDPRAILPCIGRR